MSSPSSNENYDSTRLEDIYERIETDKKRSPTMPTSTFLFLLGVGVPVWATVFLPLSIVYQTGKLLLGSSPSSAAIGDEEQESGAMPANDITPLKDRKYDLILLGATGFTGQLAVEYLLKQYGVNKNVKWAIAGRSKTKLEKVISDIANTTGNKEIMNVDIVITDTSDRSTLKNLVENTRSVATTAGPFALYGSNVVEFCAKYGTNYVDITGEKEWSKQMIAKWDNVAQKSGAKIISFCGHDSIPWDLTVYKLTEMLSKECKDDLVKVDVYDEIDGGGVSGGTLSTIYMGIDGYKAPPYDSDPWMRKPDGTKSSYKTKVETPLLPERVSISGRADKWNGFFIMAIINGEVAKRSIALRSKGNLKVTYKEGMLSNDFKTWFVNSVGFAIGGTALLNPLTGMFAKKILPKPGQGPPRHKMEKGYLCVHGVGTGSKGNQVESAMYFPKDAGYMDTARMLVESGLCLALDSAKLPVNTGGFFTPSTGMGDAILERLCNTGSMFRCRLRSKL